MSNETFASVWDAIEGTPAEAENMKLRSTLMMALEQHIRAKGWTQAEAARQLGISERTLRYRLASFREAGIAVGGSR